jgi:PAS domain S-box-containing protein
MENHDSRGRFYTRSLASVCTIYILALLLGVVSSFADQGPKEVLIIHSYQPSLSWTQAVTRGMDEALKAYGPVNIRTEWMDARQHRSAVYKKKIYDLLTYKLKDRLFDVIMVSDNDSFEFILATRKTLFKDVPVIFCGVNNFRPTMLSGQKGITGVSEGLSLRETLETALRFHPETREIVVIGRTVMPADRANRDAFVSLLRTMDFPVNFTFWDDLDTDQLKNRLSALTRGTLVFINGLTQDMTGRQLMYEGTTQFIRAHSTIPLYSLWDPYLGHGIVGGKLVTGHMQGKLSGDLAVRVLRGEDPDTIPIIHADSANRFMFDHRELVRFNISPPMLPKGSVVVNQPSSFYMVNKGYIQGGVAALFILSGIILALFLNIVGRRKAERSLLESEERYRTAIESSNDGVSIISGDVHLFVNSKFVELFGYENREEIIGQPNSLTVHPDDLQMVRNITNRRQKGESVPTRYEFKGIRKDGTPIYVEVSATNITYQGTPVSLAYLRDVTERRRSEEALRESEEKYRQLIEQATEGIIVLDGTGQFILANSRICEMLGYTPEELRHLNILDTYPPEENSETGRRRLAMLNAGESARFERLMKRRDGTSFWVYVSAVRLANGWHQSIVYDITERKKAEGLLRAQYLFLQNLIDTIPNAVFYKDKEGIYQGCNKTFEEFVGLTKEHIIGRTVFDVHPGEVAEQYSLMDRELFSCPGIQSYDSIVQHSSGTKRDVIITKATYNETDGHVAGLIGVMVDITEHRRAQEDLGEKENLLRATLESTADGFLVVDENGRVTHANARFAEIWRIPPDIISGGDDHRLLQHVVNQLEDPESFLAKVQSLYQTKTEAFDTIRFKDGRFLERYSCPLFRDHKVSGRVWSFRDVTARRLAEKALEEAEEKYREIFENAVEGIFQTTRQGQFLTANKAMARMWGYNSSEDLIADTAYLVQYAYVDPEFPLEFARQLEREGEVSGFEAELQRKDGGTFWVSLNARVVRNGEGEVLYYEGTAKDITSGREAQEQIRASLHEKDVLLKEIHHRVKNNLQIISSLLHMQSHYISDPRDVDLFRTSMDRIKSMALIHEKLYRSGNLARIFFPDYVKDLTNDLLHIYGLGKDLTVSLKIDPISLNIDNALPLGLIINELVSNSLKHAFPQKMDGNLGVRLRCEGDDITLTVSDDGVGLPGEMDFTDTQSLGMQLVVALVEQLDGTITLESSKGTDFIVRFRKTD